MECLLSSATWIGGISTIANLLFLLLFILRPPASINFRGYQLLSVFVNFLFAITQFTAAPLFFGDGTNYIFLSCRPHFEYSIVLFLIAQNSLFMMPAIIFCFRYAMLCNARIRTMIETRLQFAILWILHFSELVFSLIPALYLFQPSTDLKRSLHEKYDSAFRRHFLQEYFLGASYDFCGFEIARFITIKAKSRKLRRVNRHVLIIMSLQVFASTIFVYLPGVVVAFCMIIRVDISAFSHLLSSSLSGGTLFSPFIAIVMTKEYRIRLCSSRKEKRMEPSKIITASTLIRIN